MLRSCLMLHVGIMYTVKRQVHAPFGEMEQTGSFVSFVNCICRHSFAEGIR